MKAGHDIAIDRKRSKTPPGGEMAALDPVARGRVQVLDCRSGDVAQAMAAVDELVRLGTVKLTERWGICAIKRGMSKIARDPLYRRHRFPAERSLRMQCGLYFRFPLSSLWSRTCWRPAHLDRRPPDGSRTWAEKFGRHFANEIRRRSAGRLGDGLDRLQYGHRRVDDKVEDGIDNEILALSDRRGAPAVPVRKSVTPDYIISLEDVR